MPKPSSHTALDESQFEELFKSHFQYLYNFARQYVSDASAAQDITQKVFLTLWEKREEIDTKKSVKSYLFTAVKNRCLNYIRDNQKYQSKLLDVDCGEVDVAVEEDHFAVEELSAKIEAALDTLPPVCRQVFEMSRYREMKYKEIAAELNISQKTVEAHMRRAMKGLREYLKEYLLMMLLLLKIM